MLLPHPDAQTNLEPRARRGGVHDTPRGLRSHSTLRGGVRAARHAQLLRRAVEHAAHLREWSTDAQ